jgi:DNA polymerase-3 subunit delta
MSGDVPILAYLRGDDGWSLDRAVGAIATQLGDATGAPPERWRVTGAETSAAVINERVATAPMFGGGTVAAIVDPGPLVRSRESRDGLEHAIRNVAPGNALVFIEQGDSGGRRSAALQRLETTVRAAGGDVKAFKAPRGGELTAWVRDRAAERGMSLEPAAAKELASRIGGFVKEGDVDRQRQSALAIAELDKLALYRGSKAVTEADVRALVSEVVPDSTWAFLDAVADRRSSAAGPLLDHLLGSTPEPVVIVQLHRRLRELLEVADHLAAGASPASLVRTLKLNPYRAEILARQARRWTLPELEAALEGVLDLDAMVKRAPGFDASDRQRRLAFVLWVRERVAGAAVQPSHTR